jgi:3'-phosphoadenosine 5'-phosphosulfate (PAPS) 3'-phosphatase
MAFWDAVAGNSLLHEIGGGFYYLNGEMVKYDISNGNKYMKDYFVIFASKEKLNIFLDIKNKNSEYFKDNFNV